MDGAILKKLFCAAAVAALSLSGAAHSAITVYTVAGTFVDGAALSGTFTIDDTKQHEQAYLNVDLSVGNLHFDQYEGDFIGGNGNTAPIFLTFGSVGDEYPNISLYMTATFDNYYTIQSIADQAINTDYTVYRLSGGNQVRLSSGTITSAPAAVPEPASWAMMVGGFGLIGATMRRKKVNVSFA